MSKSKQIIRICKICNQVKNLEEFDTSRPKKKSEIKKITYRFTCKVCEKKQRKIYNLF